MFVCAPTPKNFDSDFEFRISMVERVFFCSFVASVCYSRGTAILTDFHLLGLLLSCPGSCWFEGVSSFVSDMISYSNLDRGRLITSFICGGSFRTVILRPSSV